MGSGSAALSGPSRRCARHALAVGPDGLCALCRSESLPPPRSFPTWMIVGVLGAILVVTGTAVAFRTVTSLAQAAITREPSPEAADAEPPSEESIAEPEPPSEQAVAEPAPPSMRTVAEPPSTRTVAEPLEPPSFAPIEPAPTVAAAPTAPPVVEPLAVPEEPAAPARPPPHQTELQAALSATPIVMYSASWCGVCRRAREFFAANNLRYQEIDADTTPGAWEKIQELTGSRGVPLIIVDGEQTPGGLSPSDIMQAVSRSVERRLGVRGIQIKAN